MVEFKDLTQALILKNSGWEHRIMLTRQILKDLFRELIANCRRELLDKLEDSLVKISENRMRHVLVNFFNNLPAN